MSGHADGGARRRQVLEAIYRSPAPLGASEIAGQVGIHPNTARFHLAALMAEGVIERTVAEPSGPAARASSTGRAPGWRAVGSGGTGPGRDPARVLHRDRLRPRRR